jgi:uncharacterized protein
MMSRLLGALLLAGLLSACSSSPASDYYVLSAQSEQAAARQIGPQRIVAVGAITLPGALDRPQLARRVGPNQFEYAESERWAGPLDDMMRRVLSADLRSLLLPAGTTVIAAGSPAPAETTIAIEVSRFDADQAGRVELDASWEMLDNNRKIVGVPREAKIIEPGTGSDAATVAATMSRALAGLAEHIALGISAAAGMR